MKRTAAYMSILAFAASAFSLRADDLPARFAFNRYQSMLDHSPFAVATAVVAPAATPAPCKDLFIANAARSQDGDSVTLMSSADREFKKYLNTKTPVDGFVISSIEWSDKVGETKVTISKDGQFCTLTFNQAEMSKPVPRQPGAPAAPGFAPAPPQPAPQPGMKPGQPPPPVAFPTPHVRATIQRNPVPSQYTPIPRTPPPSTVEDN
ncbi:MAG TPA: hypothetical protein VH170_08710 [Chthoniobacterales bacterium]|jgi:hypothetical protein|nr:hypothetical protein [Chthoniobacterales bacterium]